MVAVALTVSPNASVPLKVTVVPAIARPVVDVVRLPAGVVFDTRLSTPFTLTAIVSK